MNIDNITGIIVSYNTADLLRACVESIRKFYPTLKLIIIDGSDRNNPCFEYSRSIKDQYTRVENLCRNIGHGRGMTTGIALCQTEYFLLIDSDTEILQGRIIERLYTMLTTDNVYTPAQCLYGVGQVVFTDANGHNTNNPPYIRYLHPHFALIRKSIYLILPPIIHHGAPMIKAMNAVTTNPTTDVLNFPNLSDWILHKGRGTRALNPPEFHPGTWEK